MTPLFILDWTMYYLRNEVIEYPADQVIGIEMDFP